MLGGMVGFGVVVEWVAAEWLGDWLADQRWCGRRAHRLKPVPLVVVGLGKARMSGAAGLVVEWPGARLAGERRDGFGLAKALVRACGLVGIRRGDGDRWCSRSLVLRRSGRPGARRRFRGR